MEGENNPNASLTEQDVRFIMRSFTEGATNKELAKMFNVDSTAVSKIRQLKRWKHLSSELVERN